MLSGDRVTLRPVRPDDLPLLYEFSSDRTTWVNGSDEPFWPKPFAEFEKHYAKLAADEAAEFVIDVDGTVVGRCALHGLDDESRNASIGIEIGAPHQGNGFGRDAVRVLLHYAFVKRNLHRVQLECLSTNAAALRVYEVCGFVEEGRLREHAYAGGQFVDLVVMGALRSEWLAASTGR